VLRKDRRLGQRGPTRKSSIAECIPRSRLAHRFLAPPMTPETPALLIPPVGKPRVRPLSPPTRDRRCPASRHDWDHVTAGSRTERIQSCLAFVEAQHGPWMARPQPSRRQLGGRYCLRAVSLLATSTLGPPDPIPNISAERRLRCSAEARNTSPIDP
jgi:hypothetical protein